MTGEETPFAAIREERCSKKGRQQPMNKEDKTPEMGNRGISTISEANSNHPVLYFASPSVAAYLQWF